jgi:hypothetical protein
MVVHYKLAELLKKNFVSCLLQLCYLQEMEVLPLCYMDMVGGTVSRTLNNWSEGKIPAKNFSLFVAVDHVELQQFVRQRAP